MVRLFVCIWIPDDIVSKIENLQKKLVKSGVIGKYVEKNNFHVTVTFIGEVHEDGVKIIKNKLDSCFWNFGEFDVILSGLKLIPNKNYVRVIGINVISEDLKKLIKTVGGVVGGSFYEDQKITLCRVKKINNKVQFQKFVNDNINVNLGDFHVNSISLVKSTLTRKGPIYENIFTFGLKSDERGFSN